ncbi:MAG: CBS domain-containing protein [Terriglobales bacterium]
MKVREIMTPNVKYVAPDTSLDEVAQVMRDEDVGVVPVIDNGELCGVITDRDIVVRCVAEGNDPAEVEADEVLSENVQTIEPDEDVAEAARIMAEEQIRRLPVVEGGRLVGMLSLGDIAVKQPDEQLTGDVLENVSEGVKAAAPGQRRGPATAPVSAPQAAAVAGGGRQAQMEEQAGRRATRPSRGMGTVAEGEIDRGMTTGARQQGMADRPATEEQQPQSKVVPIRREQVAAEQARAETRTAGKRRASPDAEQAESPGARRVARQQKSGKRRAS